MPRNGSSTTGCSPTACVKPASLMQRSGSATGKGLDPSFYIEHLTRKYSNIYGI